jgi:prepilin-type N-terminal cleavage/methylation domain-containing protein
MPRRRASRGFTLIELLVVIAIIAILSATLMPALSSATDRSRVTECRANLTHVAMALRMYFDDYGRYPEALPQVAAGGYVTDDGLLRCTKTGDWYYYAPPDSRTPPEATVVACVALTTPAGQRPHAYRTSLVLLQRGGKIVESDK